VSVGKSQWPGQVPGWMDHDWTPADRLHAIRDIMAFSSRDWSKHPHAEPGHDDPECWALWLLANAEGRGDALAQWDAFCFPGRAGPP
jgi:hypothetical protein